MYTLKRGAMLTILWIILDVNLDNMTISTKFGLPKVTELTRWQPINNVTKLILKFNNQSDISILTIMREVVPNVANELGLQYISIHFYPILNIK